MNLIIKRGDPLLVVVVPPTFCHSGILGLGMPPETVGAGLKLAPVIILLKDLSLGTVPKG